jgi:hypothetical protein
MAFMKSSSESFMKLSFESFDGSTADEEVDWDGAVPEEAAVVVGAKWPRPAFDSTAGPVVAAGAFAAVVVVVVVVVVVGAGVAGGAPAGVEWDGAAPEEVAVVVGAKWPRPAFDSTAGPVAAVGAFAAVVVVVEVEAGAAGGAPGGDDTAGFAATAAPADALCAAAASWSFATRFVSELNGSDASECRGAGA